ncbi:hypothetical protein RG959_20650 [Domibacillus sp. 8LH]|uniref:hypothetical protein n=1 Tax=Domibacillus sp. 8LH TaxID=3073900 RepID=UPI0031735D1D
MMPFWRKGKGAVFGKLASRNAATIIAMTDPLIFLFLCDFAARFLYFGYQFLFGNRAEGLGFSDQRFSRTSSLSIAYRITLYEVDY